MAHNESLLLPEISEVAADQLLRDVGLKPNGAEDRDTYDRSLHINT